MQGAGVRRLSLAIPGKPASLLAKNLLRQGPQTNPSSFKTKELVTSNLDFFIRNHFTTPKISDEAWRLEVGGLVSKPMKLSYSDLLLMPSVRHPSTLECAGNASGGAGVGTAVWSGLPLGELLQQVGVKPGATTIVFHGADSGEGEDVPPGTHFARAIPLEKAMEPATLLAYEINGEPLPADHGFPLRAAGSGLVRNGFGEMVNEHRDSGSAFQRIFSGCKVRLRSEDMADLGR